MDFFSNMDGKIQGLLGGAGFIGQILLGIWWIIMKLSWGFLWILQHSFIEFGWLLPFAEWKDNWPIVAGQILLWLGWVLVINQPEPVKKHLWGNLKKAESKADKVFWWVLMPWKIKWIGWAFSVPILKIVMYILCIPWWLTLWPVLFLSFALSKPGIFRFIISVSLANWMFSIHWAAAAAGWATLVIWALFGVSDEYKKKLAAAQDAYGPVMGFLWHVTIGNFTKPKDPEAELLKKAKKTWVICGECGKKYRGNSPKCPDCGDPNDIAPRQCPDCKHMWSHTTNFCPTEGCGRDLRPSKEEEEENDLDLIECPHCGEQIPAISVFCPKCREVVDETAPQAKAGGKGKKSPKKKTPASAQETSWFDDVMNS